MPVSLLASLVALALATGGAPERAVRDTALAAASPLPHQAVMGETLAASSAAEALHDEVAAALAPAPEKVVRTTRSFGTVTIDHRAHLARKAHCIQCHGPGAVTKIVFTPRVAHDRCIGCHRQEKRGPMVCRDCHVVAPPPPILQAEAEPVAPPPPPPPPDPAVVAAKYFAFEREAAPPSEAGFSRILSIGYTGVGGGGSGPAVQFSVRHEGLMASLSVESPGRTLGLLGVGGAVRIARRFGGTFNATASAVGGFDAARDPTLEVMPALGGRVGVEWLGDRSMVVGLSLTGISDLVHPTDALGRSPAGVTMCVGANVGWIAAK